MSAAGGPGRPADETEDLLSTGNSGHSHPRPLRCSVWIQHSSHAFRVAWATLPIRYIYVLLVFLPLGFVARPLGWHPITVSIFNFLSIIPLSALVSFSSDQLSDRVGELVGELINATFGNAVELSVCHL
jgi:Ca2+:H+ antiporter